MATAVDNTISVLNGLINTNKNAEEGFQNAADNISDFDLKSVFEQHAMRRQRFATELQDLVVELGGSPEHTGSTAGALHRSWMDVRASVNGGDSKAMLSECERGEDQAVADYKAALEETDLDQEARDLIERQFNEVKRAHDQVKALRDRD